jgi:hypothetical protein
MRAWMDQLAQYGMTKAGLADTLNVAGTSHDALAAESYGPVIGALSGLLKASEDAGTIRVGLDPDDILLIRISVANRPQDRLGVARCSSTRPRHWRHAGRCTKEKEEARQTLTGPGGVTNRAAPRGMRCPATWPLVPRAQVRLAVTTGIRNGGLSCSNADDCFGRPKLSRERPVGIIVGEARPLSVERPGRGCTWLEEELRS